MLSLVFILCVCIIFLFCVVFFLLCRMFAALPTSFFWFCCPFVDSGFKCFCLSFGFCVFFFFYFAFWFTFHKHHQHKNIQFIKFYFPQEITLTVSRRIFGLLIVGIWRFYLLGFFFHFLFCESFFFCLVVVPVWLLCINFFCFLSRSVFIIQLGLYPFASQ